MKQSSHQAVDDNLYKPLTSEPLSSEPLSSEPLTPEPDKPLVAEPNSQEASRRRRGGVFKESWQVGLLSCFDDVGLCLQSALCPCIAAGLILEFTKTTSFYSGCVVTMVPVLGCCYLCLARTEIRGLHQIRGSYVRDLAVSFFLLPCALFQAGYEIDTRPSQIMNRF